MAECCDYAYVNWFGWCIAERCHLKLFIVSVRRHLQFSPSGNNAIRSADLANPTLEPNMKWIGLPFAELWPSEMFQNVRLVISQSIVSRSVVNIQRVLKIEAKNWELAGSGRSYCKNKQAYFFGRRCTYLHRCHVLLFATSGSKLMRNKNYVNKWLISEYSN